MTAEKLRCTVFYALWTFFSSAYFLFVASSLKYIINISEIYSVCQYVTILGLAVLLLRPNYKVKYLVLTVFLLFISILVLNKDVMIIFLFAITARSYNLNNFLKFDILIKLFWIAFIIFMFFIGLLPNLSGMYNGTYKESWGFQHPNTLGMNFNVMLMEYLCLKYKKLKFFDIILTVTGFGFVYLVTKARTSCYAFILVATLLLISKIYPGLFRIKPAKFLMIFSAPILALLTIFLTVQYDKRTQFIVWLNSVLTGRIRLQNLYWNRYDITLFGQDFDENFLYFLDSGYLRALLELGLIFLVVLCLCYILFMKRCMDNSRIEYAFLALFCILLGFTESSFLKITVNVSLVMLFNEKMFDQTTDNYSIIKYLEKLIGKHLGHSYRKC